MFDKIFKSNQEVQNNQEIKTDALNSNKDELLLFEDNQNDYDGNIAIKRQNKINEIGVSTFNSLKSFLKQNNLTDDEKLKLISTVKDLKNNHSFDVAHVSGQLTPTRLNLFPGSVKNKLLKKLINKSNPDFNEKEIINILKNGQADFEKIRQLTAKGNQEKQAQDKEKQERINNFETKGNKNELITVEGPMLIIETHAKDDQDGLNNINQLLPQDINKQMLKINYQENVNARAEGQLADNSGYTEITDSSGRISEAYLGEIFNDSENASIVLTGGNVRGCLSESLKNCLDGVLKSQLKSADIHVILDRCYDASVYDDVAENNLPFSVAQSLKNKANIEMYLDQKIQDVYEKDSDEAKRIKLFLWSKLEKFSNKVNDSVALAKVRQSINKKPL